MVASPVVFQYQPDVSLQSFFYVPFQGFQHAGWRLRLQLLSHDPTPTVWGSMLISSPFSPRASSP
jgi:hypothetical protein